MEEFTSLLVQAKEIGHRMKKYVRGRLDHSPNPIFRLYTPHEDLGMDNWLLSLALNEGDPKKSAIIHYHSRTHPAMSEIDTKIHGVLEGRGRAGVFRVGLRNVVKTAGGTSMEIGPASALALMYDRTGTELGYAVLGLEFNQPVQHSIYISGERMNGKYAITAKMDRRMFDRAILDLFNRTVPKIMRTGKMEWFHLFGRGIGDTRMAYFSFGARFKGLPKEEHIGAANHLLKQLEPVIQDPVLFRVAVMNLRERWKH